MKRTWLCLGAAGLLLWGTNTLATEGIEGETQDAQRSDDTLRTLPSGGRWVAALDERQGRHQLLVMDLHRGAVYQLAEFSGQPMIDAHWVGENRLELDLERGSTRLLVEEASGETEPTFRLVTSALQGSGATRVDYYSAPLLAFHQPQDELRAVLAAAAGRDLAVR